MSLAIDAGSSFLKVYDGQRSMMFPSVVHRLMGAANYRDAIAVQGTRYAVGQTALLGQTRAQVDPHVERGFHGSREQYVQICYALAQLGTSGEHDTLALSLPYADSQNAVVRERLKAQSLYKWQDHDGHENCTTFGRVTIMPQGVGALRIFQAKQRYTPNAATLVDIGSCTLDVVTVQMDPRIRDYQYNADACGSFRDVSVTWFKNNWEGRIRQLDGLQTRRFGYHQLMGLALQDRQGAGYLRLRQGHEQIDVSAQFAKASVDLTEAVYARVRDVTGDIWPDIECVILTGGGAALIDDLAWPDWQRTTRLDVFANVRGQYLATRSTDRSNDTTQEAVA